MFKQHNFEQSRFMILSILSLLTALLIVIYPFSLDAVASWLPIIMAVTGTAFLLVVPLAYVLSLMPLGHLEQRLAPRLLEYVYRDKWLHITYIALLGFTLLSYVMASLLDSIRPYLHVGWAIWIVGLGIALDLLRYQWKRMARFLDPFYLVDFFTHEAKRAIQTQKDQTLWGLIDSLSEIALRSVENNQIAIAMQALSAFPPIMQNFFSSSKSISRINLDQTTERETGQDEASYTVFYLLQRLNLIQSEAAKKQSEMICSQMIVILGKIIVHGARYDLSIITMPAHFLGRFALEAQNHQLYEVPAIATSTLLEVSKRITTEIDLTYVELEEPFHAIIGSLEAIAKATFKQDKTINIAILTQPFKDLRSFFETEKMASHRDTPAILQNIDRVLGEFAALEQIMRTIPPIPDLLETENASPSPT